MTRQKIYEAMKRYGHSPAKALEIAIDYERGDAFARQWIEAAMMPEDADLSPSGPIG